MYKEFKKLYAEDLRGLCVRYNFYNIATADEYEELFQLACGNIDTDKIERIATEIITHSDCDAVNECEVEDIMWMVNSVCKSTFKKLA